MGDESMVSGMSEPGLPAGGAGAGVGAEGIMKKLSNYWFIVGSIPLVLFLLVCLPTVFYVKSISEYKNAFYCRSKACDALADATKAAREAKPCDDYFTSVCSAAKGFSSKEVADRDGKLLNAGVASWGDTSNKRSPAATFAAACKKDSLVGAESLDPSSIINIQKLEDFLGAKDSHEDIFLEAQKLGIDSLFHLEWMHSSVAKAFDDKNKKPAVGEELPKVPQVIYDVAVSVPDMGIMEPNHYLLTLGGLKYEDIARALSDVDADTRLDIEGLKEKIPGVLKKMYELIELSKDLDATAAPVVVKSDDFAQVNPVPPRVKKDNVYFTQLINKIISGYKKFLVRSPNYVKLLALAINTCDASDTCELSLSDLTLFMYLDFVIRLQGYTLFTNFAKLDMEIKYLWCMRTVDWLAPSALTVVIEKYLKEKYWPFALNNPKDSKTPLAPTSLGYKYMSMLLDSFQHSYALSAASSEKSRAGLYTKILQMEFFAFYKNETDKVDEAYLDVISKATFPDEFDYAKLWDIRKEFFKAYWATDKQTRTKPQHLIARQPLMYGDDEGSYDYGTNVMYVPFGMFRPAFYRDSLAYMGNYATFGYYGSMNILKLLDHAGGYTKAGYQHPVLWTGTYAMGKMSWMHRCVNPEKTNNTDTRLVVKGSKPITPGYRFFRRQALVRAYPRPEYRLDMDAKADMEQIYLSAVMRTYCRYKKMKDTVNKMFMHDQYFQNTYCSADIKGKMKRAPNKLCYIWQSTRREY